MAEDYLLILAFGAAYLDELAFGFLNHTNSTFLALMPYG